MSKGPKVRMTVYVDADHPHDLVTRRFITGILMMWNKTPVRWVSKCQKTVETSTHGSKILASRIAAELILEVKFMLRSIGMDLDGPTLMLGDDKSFVLHTSVPSIVLMKKHDAIAYHWVREVIAAKVMRFAYVKSEDNVSDILTKPLSNERFHHLVKNWLFRVPEIRKRNSILECLKCTMHPARSKGIVRTSLSLSLSPFIVISCAPPRVCDKWNQYLCQILLTETQITMCAAVSS
jgi:hypothetical protein